MPSTTRSTTGVSFNTATARSSSGRIPAPPAKASKARKESSLSVGGGGPGVPDCLAWTPETLSGRTWPLHGLLMASGEQGRRNPRKPFPKCKFGPQRKLQIRLGKLKVFCHHTAMFLGQALMQDPSKGHKLAPTKLIQHVRDETGSKLCGPLAFPQTMIQGDAGCHVVGKGSHQSTKVEHDNMNYRKPAMPCPNFKGQSNFDLCSNLRHLFLAIALIA